MLNDKALLPSGLRDGLPPDAAFEVRAVERLMEAFTLWGYDRVKPPLIEFEENLLSGSGVALSGQTFRLMDPVSQRMMGLRPDITMQVARIATSRLRRAPRPLRLSYAGQVLRIKGSQLRPERQFGQIGAEIIGVENTSADVEVIMMAIESLEKFGLRDLSVDLGLPTLVPTVFRAMEIPEKVLGRLRTALNRKDATAVASLKGPLGKTGAKAFSAMVRAGGPASKALERLHKIDLPDEARPELDALTSVVEEITRRVPKIKLTIDPVELRGFEYHTGVTFAFFSKMGRGELGRGGRYLAGSDGKAEPATGFSLFMDSVIGSIERPEPAPRVFIPIGVPEAEIQSLRAEGWVAVNALEKSKKPEAEARRLKCSHFYKSGKPCVVKKKKGS